MHEARRLDFGVMQSFLDRYECQLKFVVDRPEDFAEMADLLSRLKNVKPGQVLVMAQGRSAREIRAKTKWIVELCKKHAYGYTPRLHIDLYGNRRGT